MPELPEVEVVRQSLVPLVTGRTIQAVEVFDGKFHLSVSELLGRRIDRIDRKGKFLFFRLTGQVSLLVHLGMTGALIFEERGMVHHHLRLAIGFGDRNLYYFDQRRFGRVRYLDRESERVCWEQIGVDPLSSEYDRLHLPSLLLSRSCRVKDFLLDQRVISGIGNIYACEILFRSRIHPEKRVNRLSPAEIDTIFRTIPQVLNEAIALRGTTIRDFRRSDGRKGEYQNQLCVYGRAGLLCPECGQTIERLRFSNRSSFFCTQCQKA